MKILILLISVIVLGQSKDDCFKESMIQNNYYITNNYLYKGYRYGEINFNIEIDFVNSNQNNIVFFVFEKDKTNQKFPIVGVNCAIVCAMNEKLDKFKIKKNLAVSDINGKINLKTNIKKLKYFSINYPGFNAKVFDYKIIANCK